MAYILQKMLLYDMKWRVCCKFALFFAYICRILCDFFVGGGENKSVDAVS